MYYRTILVFLGNLLLYRLCYQYRTAFILRRTYTVILTWIVRVRTYNALRESIGGPNGRRLQEFWTRCFLTLRMTYWYFGSLEACAIN